MDRTPGPGELYRHFKNKIYQVICIANHSETGEKLVVYQAMYGDFKICARPLEMFVSEVDHEKYPDVTQKYRFEKISDGPGSGSTWTQENLDDWQRNDASDGINDVKGHMSEDAFRGDRNESVTDIYERNAEMLSEFLDARTCREKLNILESMRTSMNETLIGNIAMSLDLNIRPGTVEEQYDQIVYGLKTMMRFEDTRRRM